LRPDFGYCAGMVAEPRLISAQDLIVAADYGQIYIYSPESTHVGKVQAWLADRKSSA